MSPAVERLKPEIAALSADERAQLADFLMDTLSADDRQEIEEAWLPELHRREAELDRGEVQAIPGDQVFQRLRKPGNWLERTSE